MLFAAPATSRAVVPGPAPLEYGRSAHTATQTAAAARAAVATRSRRARVKSDRFEGRNHEECHGAIGREFPVQEPDAQGDSLPDGPLAQRPDQEHIQEGLHRNAERTHELTGRPWGRGHEERRREYRSGGRQADVIPKDAHQEQRRRRVQEQERQLERKDGRAEDEEDRRRNPRLHGQEVVLPVVEQGEGPALAQVLGHEAGHSLIGVEGGLLPPDEHRAAQQHQAEHGQRHQGPRVACGPRGPQTGAARDVWLRRVHAAAIIPGGHAIICRARSRGPVRRRAGRWRCR